MDRPTSTEVDLALMISRLDSPTASNAAKLLALEVRALQAEQQEAHDKLVGAESELRELREEMEGWKEEAGDAEELRAEVASRKGWPCSSCGFACSDIDDREELRATITRVKALVPKWMDYVVYGSGGVPDCAKDLEDVLKGGE